MRLITVSAVTLLTFGTPAQTAAFGSLAVSELARGIAGYSFDSKTQAAADHAAIEQCKANVVRFKKAQAGVDAKCHVVERIRKQGIVVISCDNFEVAVWSFWDPSAPQPDTIYQDGSTVTGRKLSVREWAALDARKKAHTVAAHPNTCGDLADTSIISMGADTGDLY